MLFYVRQFYNSSIPTQCFLLPNLDLSLQLQRAFQKKGELSKSHSVLHESHIRRWLDQFPKKIQKFLILESFFIFKSSYFSSDRIDNLLLNFIKEIERMEKRKVRQFLQPLSVLNLANKAHVELSARLCQLLKHDPSVSNKEGAQIYYYMNDFIDDGEVQVKQILQFLRKKKYNDRIKLYIFGLDISPSAKKVIKLLIKKAQAEFVSIELLVPQRSQVEKFSSFKAKHFLKKIEKEYGPEVNDQAMMSLSYRGGHSGLPSIYWSEENGWYPLFKLQKSLE